MEKFKRILALRKKMNRHKNMLVGNSKPIEGDLTAFNDIMLESIVERPAEAAADIKIEVNMDDLFKKGGK